MKGLVNSALGQELRLLAAKWIDNPNQREAFVNAFLVVKNKRYHSNEIFPLLS